MGLLLSVYACSNSTNPDPDNVQVSFSPQTLELQAAMGDTIFFQVSRTPGGDMDVTWETENEMIGSEPVFVFVPLKLGDCNIDVVVVTDGREFSSSWSIHVGGGNQEATPNIYSLNINYGREIGEISVSWPRIIAPPAPIDHYLLVYSNDGPISGGNWNEATSLGSVAEDTGLALHSISFFKEDGIIGGEMVWLGVVAVDERGFQSEFPGGGSIVPTYAWYVQGKVFSDSGQTLHSVIVDCGSSTPRVITNQAGEFSSGPFSSRNNVNLFTVTSDTPGEGSGFFGAYYDVDVSDIEPSKNIDLNIYLISRYGMDNGCSAAVYSGDFLKYFMELTRTRRITPGRSDRCIYKWENYPIRVFIPEHTNEFDIDMEATSLAGLELWNTIMGEDYFELVDSKEAANIYFKFDNSIPIANGRATMIQPEAAIGDAIPEIVEIYINDVNSSAQWIQEIAMHELCHALGCGAHVICNMSGYLMFFDPSGALDGDDLDAIHIDEQRMIRAIRYLPMGYDMTAIEIDD